MSTATAYVGLGANLGAAETTLRQAIETLRTSTGVQQTKMSGLYRSDPVDAPGPTYVNGVVEIVTTLAPLCLLAQLRALELQFGRQRHFRNAPRTLDLDLLLYDHLDFETPTLTVPHPRLHQRAFVLKPLIELAGTQRLVAGKALDIWLSDCIHQQCTPLR